MFKSRKIDEKKLKLYDFVCSKSGRYMKKSKISFEKVVKVDAYLAPKNEQNDLIWWQKLDKSKTYHFMIGVSEYTKLLTKSISADGC